MRGPTSDYYWNTNQKQAHASEYDKIIHVQLHELKDVTECYIYQVNTWDLRISQSVSAKPQLFPAKII